MEHSLTGNVNKNKNKTKRLQIDRKTSKQTNNTSKHTA
jgi:hypothetical protein